MNTYNIYMPPLTEPDSDIASAVYLPDNKAWFAIIAPPLWFIWHRMWWGLAVYVAYLTIVFLLLLTPMRYAVIFLSAIPGIYLFLEGHELVRQQHENSGWWQIGVVQGASEEDAILRYTFNHNLQPHEKKSTDTETHSTGMIKPLGINSRRHGDASKSIGIFPMDDTA